MKHFHSYLKSEISSLIDKEKLPMAEELNESIGEDIFDITSPQHFTGDPESKLVLIHLNPKRDKKDFDKVNEFQSVNEYYNYYRYFGKNVYGSLSTKKHKSPFDRKQLRFLKELNYLPFTGEEMEDLELSIDGKLQLELIPYGSPNFDYKKIPDTILDSYVENLLETVTSLDRDYILFCGSVFKKSELLNRHIVKKTVLSKNLPKKDGSLTKMRYEIINTQLQYKGRTIEAAILPHFTIQGAPLTEYGKFVYSNYSKHL